MNTALASVVTPYMALYLRIPAELDRELWALPPRQSTTNSSPLRQGSDMLLQRYLRHEIAAFLEFVLDP